MPEITQKTLKMIQKLKARVIKLLEGKTSERIRTRTEEEDIIYRRVLQEAEKEERDILARLKEAERSRPKAATQKRPSMKSKQARLSDLDPNRESLLRSDRKQKGQTDQKKCGAARSRPSGEELYDY